jgi:hypothetical protein
MNASPLTLAVRIPSQYEFERGPLELINEAACL